MLNEISIRNFAIIDSLNHEFKSGMTSFTGETGAGKSIVFDAISALLGGKVDLKKVIKTGEESSEIIATFDIENNIFAQNILKENDLLDGEELIIRRVLKKTGKNKSYINSRPVNLSVVKELSQYLIDIHGQHGQQLLLKESEQLTFLDNFANNNNLLKEIETIVKNYNNSNDKLNEMKKNFTKNKDRIDLLSYQLNELKELELSEGKFEEQENEFNTLNSASEIMELGTNINSVFNEEQGILDLINKVESFYSELTGKVGELPSVAEMLETARINLNEVASEIESKTSNITPDESRLGELDIWLGKVYPLAKKHMVQPNELFSKEEEIEKEIQNSSFSQEDIEILEKEIESIKEEYFKVANALSKERKRAAKKMSVEVSKTLESLNMIEDSFYIEFNKNDLISTKGFDTISFYIRANKGQDALPMKDAASGGELSRIALAIHMLNAKNDAIPTIIFDEVDVGIGGETANVVGNMLKELGNSIQLLCVTHQPQVSAKSHNHLFIKKRIENEKTITSIKELDLNERVMEISRMIAGDTVTDNIIEHAKSMMIFNIDGF